MKNRLNEECRVFGLKFKESDFNVSEGGSTIVFNDFTNTATQMQSHYTTWSKLVYEREYELQNEELIDCCNKWQDLLIYEKLKLKPAVILLLIIGISEIFIWLPILIIISSKKNKKVKERKAVIERAKEIWKELKARSQQ